MKPVVHHVELCVHDGMATLANLQKFGFRPFAKREIAGYCKQYVTKLGSIFFVVTEREKRAHCRSTESSIRTEPLAILCCENEASHSVDTVFNVALSVKNVKEITERIQSYGSPVIQPPTTVQDDTGAVNFSIVRSCCGNVVHTLLNIDHYSGAFLPGYKLIDCVDDIDRCSDLFTLNEKVSHIDHVTLATHGGDSTRIIRFYESCFGMKRFSISSNDDDTEGLILDDGVGLRLRAMEYWRCAETGLLYEPSTNAKNCDKPLRQNGVMFVVVESLPGQYNCNVETYLKEHQKPGVEHIALSSSNIFQTVTSMKNLSVEFRQPPSAYYKQLKKIKQISQIGENFEQLENLGILLDNEVEPGAEPMETPKYLMQIFAHPLFFPNKTFFIEVIQRSGARGLGAGNIIALVKSIREDEKRKAAEEDKSKISGQIMKSPRSVC